MIDNIGYYIAGLRHERGWSQYELGERASLDHSTISKIENMKRTRPHVRTLINLALAFGLDRLHFVKMRHKNE